MNAAATAERAVVFGDRDARCVGVVTPGARPDPGVVLLNAGLLHHVGPQRMNVEIARRLSARHGASSLRFDVTGVGDSPARADGLPFRESSIVETRQAMDTLARETGASGFVLVGLCSGADQAFQVALADERVVGCVLIDPYPYETPRFRRERWLRPARQRRTWVRVVRGEYKIGLRVLRVLAGEVEERVDPGLAVRDIPPRDVAETGFRTLLERGVAVHVVFTAGQLGTYNHAAQFWDMYPSLREGGGLSYRYFAPADHTLSVRAVRELLLADVASWYGSAFRG